MAQLWIEEANAWAVVPLSGTRVALAGLPGARPDLPAVLIRAGTDERADWHLLATPSSRIAVNGLPLLDGMRTLSDKDEIRIPAAGALFFSTERLAQVEPLPVAGHEVSCPRCRQPIAPESPAVRCPGCEVWHHGSAELPCWSYAATCALCQQPTAADAGFKWTPEEL